MHPVITFGLVATASLLSQQSPSSNDLLQFSSHRLDVLVPRAIRRMTSCLSPTQALPLAFLLLVRDHPHAHSVNWLALPFTKGKV